MRWKAYSEIENTYREKAVDEVYSIKDYNKYKWHVTEKIHGSNGSLYTDGVSIRFASRNRELPKTSKMNNLYHFKNIYYTKMLDMYNYCKDFSAIYFDTLIVYGECFGGYYPHPDVDKVPDAKKIQGGIYYSPDVEFMVYDIALLGKDTVAYLDIKQAYNLFKFVDMPCIPILFSGTFEDCLTHSNNFESQVATQLGYPVIENNTCEGIVIKPETYLTNQYGRRIVFKSKNNKYTERKPKESKSPVMLLETAGKIWNTLNELITESRLRNVVSHLDSITDKDFGKLVKSYYNDVMNEYLKDNEEFKSLVSSNEFKHIHKMLNNQITDLIRKNFLNIIDNNF